MRLRPDEPVYRRSLGAMYKKLELHNRAADERRRVVWLRPGYTDDCRELTTVGMIVAFITRGFSRKRAS
ncbi:MAG: hypothetical protein WKH64_02645 [Chloroflexia bacterium]